MGWWLIIAVGAGAGLFAVCWPLRRYLRLRRKDCCGRGCGCLFPAKAPPKK